MRASRVATVGRLTAAGLLLLVMAGCTAKPASPTYVVDRSHQEELSVQARAALLSSDSLPGWADATKDGIDAVGHKLQQACRARIDTDAHIVVEQDAKWRRGSPRPVVDETVIAYDRPLGATAVDQAKAALTCTTYDSPVIDDGQLQVTGTFDTPAAGAGAALFGFCEHGVPNQRGGGQAAPGPTRCVILAGRGSLACRVRATSDGADEAKQVVLDLLPEITRRCLGGS
jgi:hypothetical protein